MLGMECVGTGWFVLGKVNRVEPSSNSVCLGSSWIDTKH